jgi:hypothetical protein
MRAPVVPSDAAWTAAIDEVVRIRVAHAGLRQPSAGELMAACAIAWPHEHDPTDADLAMVLAAWWDARRARADGRRVRPYRHDGKVIALPLTPVPTPLRRAA